MKKKIRLSFSLLNLWSMGKTDQAVSTYFHLDTQKSPQMIAGSEFHKKMSRYILKNKAFPEWFSRLKLTNPVPDREIIVKYNEMFDLKSLYDCLDVGDLHEFKTGISDSLDYAGELQIPFYFLTAKIASIPIEKAYITHYNQYEKTSDFTIIWNSERMIEKAVNLIQTLGPEIYEFFLKEGLI